MENQEEQNSNNVPEVVDQHQGRKLMKLENKLIKPEQIDFREIVHEKFDPQQIKRLIEHLKSLENYYKFVSLQIQHQERSIATLSPSILQMFPELKNRVSTMISKAKFNVEFLDLVLLPYKPLVLEALLAEKKRVDSDESEEIGHDHNCSNHNVITNMFYHMVKEWSQNAELQYCSKIINFLDKYFFNLPKKQINLVNQSSKGVENKPKILVVGFGMGRILHQIRKRYGKQGVQIQGNESDTQLYLCGQYFLNRCTKSHSVHPYLHNFCNFRTNNDPYRCLNLPSVIDEHTYYYPLTLGTFPSLYKSHQNNWDVIITIFNNYQIDNILSHLKLIYKMLKTEGIWIDLSTSNFDRNIIPFSYGQFENVLDKSQFKLLEKTKENSYWYGDQQCLMNEMRVNYYRVMKK